MYELIKEFEALRLEAYLDEIRNYINLTKMRKIIYKYIMKVLKIENNNLIVDDNVYEFLKDKRIEIKENKGKKTASISLHRMFFPKKDKIVIDHINGNSLDNRRENLREATYTQNNTNKKGYGFCKYKGVDFCKKDNRYISKICKNGIEQFLGRFNTQEEAARIYDIASLYINGAFAYLNFNINNYININLEEELFNSITKKPKNNTTGYRGVFFDNRKKKNPYSARAKTKNRINLHLGVFKTAKVAAIERDNYYRKNGIMSYIRLNFPTKDEVLIRLKRMRDV